MAASATTAGKYGRFRPSSLPLASVHASAGHHRRQRIVAEHRGRGMDDMIRQQAVQISFNRLFDAPGFIVPGRLDDIWLPNPPFLRQGGLAAVGGH